MDWDDVDGANNYWVRWRVNGPGNKLNDGLLPLPTASDATITVADYGQWRIRVQACNNSGCGEPLAGNVDVQPAPEATTEPPPEPTPETTPEPTAAPTPPSDPTPEPTPAPTPEPTTTPKPETTPTKTTQTTPGQTTEKET
ncbi:MAG: hypothetical protein F4X20_02890, partial [Dehalococcoidia bacterium]|nr:hypothetical protein [Dehalococcoidia bacterium]